MKTLYVKDLTKGMVIEGESFAIFEAEKLEDKNGKPYYRLLLGDKTGRVGGKIWNDRFANVDLKTLKVGKVISISGKTEEYQGKLQLTLYESKEISENKLEEFIETSLFSPDEMLSELLNSVASITTKELKEVLKEIIEDSEINKRLMYWPAAMTVHHDFRGGLLQHILEMIDISKGLKRFYPEIDNDILLAGIIMHDLGKLYELQLGGISATYSIEGSLIGHISKGLLIWQKFAEKKLSPDLYLHIQHLILSHHGEMQFGSPVIPSTLEAVVLTLLDNLSSKARVALKAKNSISEGSNFSNNIPWLNGAKIWKGDSDTKNSDQLTF